MRIENRGSRAENPQSKIEVIENQAGRIEDRVLVNKNKESRNEKQEWRIEN